MAFRLKTGDVFLHLPRTGGTFITSVLRKLNLIEESVGRKHDCPGVVAMDMSVRHFVFIREPYTLMRSTYSWLEGNVWGPWPKEKGDGRWWHPWNEITRHSANHRDSFEQWLRWVMCERTGYVTRLYSKFANWPCTKFVGRTEWLEDDLLVMLGMLGVRRADALGAMAKARGKSVNGSPVKVADASVKGRKMFEESEAGAMAMWEGRVL